MKNTATPLSLLSPALAQAQINRLRERLKHELSDLQSELKLLPEGSLYIKKSRNWITFYICHNGKTKGITKDKQLIYQLARRHYITLLSRFIEEFLEDICCEMTSLPFTKLLSSFDDLFGRFERSGLDLDRITMTPNQYIWNSDRESQKPTRREELIYPTIGRVFMRTKSEQMLGNLLERLHIPYRYETTITIGGINYHPDFLIMLPNGRLVIIEHVGRLDLSEYNEDLIMRLIAYNKVGLQIGRDVFFTFEKDTRDDIVAKEVLFQVFASTPSDSKFLRNVATQAGCTYNTYNKTNKT